MYVHQYKQKFEKCCNLAIVKKTLLTESELLVEFYICFLETTTTKTGLNAKLSHFKTEM